MGSRRNSSSRFDGVKQCPNPAHTDFSSLSSHVVMSPMPESKTIEQKRQELNTLKQQISVLESELSAVNADSQWHPEKFYGTYYGTVGFILGGVAAMSSLLLNVIGSTVAGKHPLEIIRVYLTFPLGEQALQLASSNGSGYVIDDGVILALGCCLYIGTGMVLGTVFHWVISRFAMQGGVPLRLFWGTLLAVAVWVINYYLILSWLQPALFGGNWITDTRIMPWWVALATHLAFGWTMALLAPLGSFTPYIRPTEIAH